jgi:hypothetical protein
MPLAYLLTFSTYGSHHHGDDRGSYRLRTHALEEPNAPLRLNSIARMQEPPFVLHEGARDVVLQAIIEHARHSEWELRAPTCVPSTFTL